MHGIQDTGASVHMGDMGDGWDVAGDVGEGAGAALQQVDNPYAKIGGTVLMMAGGIIKSVNDASKAPPPPVPQAGPPVPQVPPAVQFPPAPRRVRSTQTAQKLMASLGPDRWLVLGENGGKSRIVTLPSASHVDAVNLPSIDPVMVGAALAVLAVGAYAAHEAGWI